MNGLKSIPNWILWTAALLAAALVFRFAMRGYAYIGYTLAFIAALIVLHHYLPRGAWRRWCASGLYISASWRYR